MRFVRLATLLALMGLMVLGATVASADMLVVTPVTSEGWVITPADGTNAPGFSDFVTNPQILAPLGDGAYRVRIEGANQKTTFKRTDYVGVLLSDITTFSYQYLTISPAQLNTYYVNFYLNVDSLGDTDADHELRLDMALPVGALAAWTTVDALTAPYAFATRGGFTTTLVGTVTLADVIAAHPTATVAAAFGQVGNGGLRLNIGDTASSYLNYDGFLDNVNITAAGVAHTWDFEGEPGVVAGTELVLNGSFETVDALTTSGVADWNLSALAKGNQDCTQASDGSCSYLLNGKRAGVLSQKIIGADVEVGDLLEFSAALKGKNVVPSGVTVFAQVKYVNGLKFKALLVEPAGTFVFTPFTSSLGIFGDVSKLKVVAKVVPGAGKLWVDEVSLVLVKDGLRDTGGAPSGLLPLPAAAQ